MARLDLNESLPSIRGTAMGAGVEEAQAFSLRAFWYRSHEPGPSDELIWDDKTDISTAGDYFSFSVALSTTRIIPFLETLTSGEG